MLKVFDSVNSIVVRENMASVPSSVSSEGIYEIARLLFSTFLGFAPSSAEKDGSVWFQGPGVVYNRFCYSILVESVSDTYCQRQSL